MVGQTPILVHSSPWPTPAARPFQAEAVESRTSSLKAVTGCRNTPLTTILRVRKSRTKRRPGVLSRPTRITPCAFTHIWDRFRIWSMLAVIITAGWSTSWL